MPAAGGEQLYQQPGYDLKIEQYEPFPKALRGAAVPAEALAEHPPEKII
jgi:hypothetical protein